MAIFRAYDLIRSLIYFYRDNKKHLPNPTATSCQIASPCSKAEGTGRTTIFFHNLILRKTAELFLLKLSETFKLKQTAARKISAQVVIV